MVYAVYINLLGRNLSSAKENRESLVDTSEQVVLK
jgi:hypothetical protein